MYPNVSNVQVTWRPHGFRILSRGVDRVDPSPRDRNQSTCVKANLSDRGQRAHRSPRGCNGSARSPPDVRIKTIDRWLTWWHVEASGASDLHRTRDRELPQDLHRMVEWGRPRTTINAWSWLDHRALVAHSVQNWEPRSLQMMGHDRRAIVAIKYTYQQDPAALKIRRKFFFKKMMYFLFSS